MLSFSEKQLQELDEETGESTWHVIAKNGDVEIIRKKYFDLDEAEINFKNKEGLTPFAIAIEENNLEMVKELIKCGAKNSTDDILNFIAIAIKNKYSEMSMFLISIFNLANELGIKNKGEKSYLQGTLIVNSLEEEEDSKDDAPSCEPSCVKKIKVDKLVNYTKDFSQKNSGSRV